MRISGQEFSIETVKQIQQTIILEPDISRRDLSRRVCNWLDWRSPNGQLKDMSCRKVLLALNDKGIIELPVKANLFSPSNATRIDSELDIPHLSCDLSDIGEVIVTPVTSRYCKESKVWRALLDRYHYLGSGKLCGAQIRYVIKSSKHG